MTVEGPLAGVHENQGPDSESPKSPPGDPPLQLGPYRSLEEGLKAVQASYSTSTTRLSDLSFQLSFAIIAANWAAFGSVARIIESSWAKYSLAFAVLNLGAGLVGTWYLGKLLYRRWSFADSERDKWKAEFEGDNAARGERSFWPFTERIEDLANALRLVKTWFPIVGAVLFFVALFR